MKAATTRKPAKAKRTPPKPRKLNIRQERFAELVAAGMPATRAYSEAGYSSDPRIAEAHACRLVENGGVKARIAELRKPQTKKSLLTRDRKRELLRDIAENPLASTDNRIRAMAEDSRMAGHYEPDRTEIEVGQRTLLSIKERAMQLSRALGRRYLTPDSVHHNG
jgi:phage terminase small subunit